MYKDKIFFQKLEFLYGELKKILISVFFMGLVIVYYLHGIEAMKEIKQNFKDAKIVALTANALSTDKQKYLNDGFDGYISKPIDEDELLKTLKELL